MLRPTGEPVLMDLGLACSYAEQTRRLTVLGTPVGTPRYMSPEQVEGDFRAIGPATDVYSLGVILYELLTGRLPYEGPLLALFAQILTVAPEPPSRLRPELDPHIDALCLKTLAKKPEQRHPTASAFAAALVQYVREVAIPAAAAIAPALQNTPAENSPSPGPRPVCPKCGNPLEAPADKLGKRLRCPRCRSSPAVAQRKPSSRVPERPDCETLDTALLRPQPNKSGQRRPLRLRRRLIPGAVVLLILLLGVGLVGRRYLPREEASSVKGGDPSPSPRAGETGEGTPDDLSGTLQALVDGEAGGFAVEAFALGDLASVGCAKEVWDWARDDLLSWLRHDDARVRLGAAYALGKCGTHARPALPQLAETLRDEKASVREGVAFALGEMARSSPKDAAAIWERAGKLLLATLRDATPYVRCSAAGALRNCGAAARSAALNSASCWGTARTRRRCGVQRPGCLEE